MRANYQVLVMPFYMKNEEIKYAIFQRDKDNYWQGIAGGGEEGESVIESAKRETWEEAGITMESRYIELDTVTALPVVSVVGEFLWGPDIYVINEYCFGVEVNDTNLIISDEHCEYVWLIYEDAIAQLKWESNRTALWELNQRLLRI